MSEFQPLDPKKALSFLSHPVTIITANDGKLKNGMTAAWTTQISIDPPILCTSISPLRYTWKMLENVEYFGVSLLGNGQERVAEVFGTTSGKNTDKFAAMGMDPFMAMENVPLIPGSPAAFVCRKGDCIEQGDHFAVFGEVVEAWLGLDNEPLNWFKSAYKV